MRLRTGRLTPRSTPDSAPLLATTSSFSGPWRARARGEGAAAAFRQLRARMLVPHQLLQGAGGVGKSVLFAAMQRVMRRLGLGRFVVSAWTGVASAPFGAATLCKMLKIDWDALSTEKVMTQLDIATMQEAFEAAYCDPKELLVLGVDEVSFISPEALWQIDVQLRRLTGRKDVEFGGVLLVAAGDFWQKSPPGGPSLGPLLAAVDAPPGDKPAKALSPTGAAARGLALFRGLRRTVLTQQMRAADDPFFQTLLEHMRRTDTSAPVPKQLVAALREVSAADVRADPTWLFATIGALSHFEGDRLTAHQAELFARTFDLPLVKWRKELCGEAANWVQGMKRDTLFEEEPGLWCYFVRGAPAMLLDNIQPTKGLGNGTGGTMHSLTFEDEPPAALLAAEQAGTFSVVVLEEAPLAVNFVPNLPKDDDGRGIESLLESEIVVPVVHSTRPNEHRCASLYAAQAGVPKVVKVSCVPITCAFVCTDVGVARIQPFLLRKLCVSLGRWLVRGWSGVAQHAGVGQGSIGGWSGVVPLPL